MPEPVVDLLEMVDVRHDDRQMPAVPQEPGPLLGKAFVQGPAVGQARQRVDLGVLRSAGPADAWSARPRGHARASSNASNGLVTKSTAPRSSPLTLSSGAAGAGQEDDRDRCTGRRRPSVAGTPRSRSCRACPRPAGSGPGSRGRPPPALPCRRRHTGSRGLHGPAGLLATASASGLSSMMSIFMVFPACRGARIPPRVPLGFSRTDAPDGSTPAWPPRRPACLACDSSSRAASVRQA